MCWKKLFLIPVLFLLTLQAFGQKRNVDSVHNRSDSIIHEVKVFASKNNFISKILRNFLVIERKKSPTADKKFSNKSYDEYDGKIIRNIDVFVLDVFGPSITNISKQETGWFEKVGNDIHKDTREWVIRQRLLFRKGDLVEPLNVSESERLLRQYRNTYDARVYLTQIPNSPDSVDVFVLAQDVWSITGSGAFDPIAPSGNLNLRDVNFLGLGNELAGQVIYNARDSVPLHYTMEYTNYNIAHTFFTGTVYYRNLLPSLNYGFGVNKDFFSPVVKWAGGVNFNWLRDNQQIYDHDSLLVSTGFKNSQQELWIGFGAKLDKKKDENSYFIAGRLLNTKYFRYPLDSVRLPYQNSTLYLASIGYSFRRFIKDNYIFGLGRTEDIPVGRSLTFTAGYENGKLFKRPYMGARASLSTYFQKYGYLSGSLEWGSFRAQNEWQDEVISAEILFYSKLISIGTWRWRNFFWNRMTYGYNIPPGKFLNINSRDGIRGFSAGQIKGNKKHVTNYESIFYTPFNILGFRTGIMFFADFAFIGFDRQPLFQSKFYHAYGLGFRFRNEHLIFRTIQFTFAYYPGVKRIDEPQYKFFEESRAFYQFTNFQFTKPTVLEF